jgi:hypothetical protein
MEEQVKPDLANPRHRALCRLILARSDIRQARKVAALVIERITSVQDPSFEPLSCACATVIWYSRPFIASRGNPGIPRSYAEKFPSKADKEIHDFLIEHRNRFEAHRDKDLNEVSLAHKNTTRIVSEDGRRIGGLCSHGEFISAEYVKLAAFPRIVQLFDFQLERLKSAIDAEKELLFP